MASTAAGEIDVASTATGRKNLQRTQELKKR